MDNNNTVVGYFPSQATAESAISALKEAGFQQNQIGVAARSATTGTATSTAGAEQAIAGRARAAGQHTSGVWDKVKNFFEGNTAEPYAGEATRDPFNGRELTPEDYGSEDVHHSLSGLSVPDEHARYFGHRFSSGNEGAIVTVSARGREEEATRILEENGGDVGGSATGYDYGAESTSPLTGEQNVQLYGEVLRVHKDRVSRGEVRLRKEVNTTTQTIEVPVTREELVVERVPVTGEKAASGATFEEQEIRIPLSEERASVDKESVLRENVRVGKKEVTEVNSFDEQVRSEDLKVDQNIKGKTA